MNPGNPTPNRIIQSIKTEAARLGFISLGVTAAQTPPEYHRYQQWCRDGRQAGMAYMASERSQLVRRHPQLLLPGARSIISLAYPYPFPPPDPGPAFGRVAAYALIPDYHLILKQKLQSLTNFLRCIASPGFTCCSFTDSAPVLERSFASNAGLGWIGRNSCLIIPSFGSFFFLAEIFTDLELDPSDPFTRDLCGSCSRCIQACPTGCILPDRTIDSARCISYLTIEHRAAIPAHLRSSIGNRIFGCDACQVACPWNRFYATTPHSAELQETRRPQLLVEEITLNQLQFENKYAGNAVLRARRSGYLRNVAVALGNAADPQSIPILVNLLTAEPDPLVRVHAAWALGRFSKPKVQASLEQQLRSETHPEVIAELLAALKGQGSQ